MSRKIATSITICVVNWPVARAYNAMPSIKKLFPQMYQLNYYITKQAPFVLLQRKENCEGEASGDEIAQNGGPKTRDEVPIDPLVSPASDVEEDIHNTSQRMTENDEKDCDSSRSSSPGKQIFLLFKGN